MLPLPTWHNKIQNTSEQFMFHFRLSVTSFSSETLLTYPDNKFNKGAKGAIRQPLYYMKGADANGYI